MSIWYTVCPIFRHTCNYSNTDNNNNDDNKNDNNSNNNNSNTHRSGRLPGAYVLSGKTTRVFNRPPRSRGRVLDVNFWFSRILGFLAESGPFAPLVFGIRKNITISRPFYVLFYVLFEGMADIYPSVMM